MAAPARRPAGVPAVVTSVFPEIPPSIVHASKDLFTAVDLQPLYARFVRAPINPGSYPRSFVSDVSLDSRRGSNVADASAPPTPGGKDASSANDKAGIPSQVPMQTGSQSRSNQRKPPKAKLFSSVYEELLQEIPDPVPLPPNESLLDIPYHRYPNHLDDPDFRFASLVTSDKAKMALRLQVGHAHGVAGKYADGMKTGVKSANQRRKERIRNKKNKDAQQRATAPANLTSSANGIISAASSPEYRGAMTPSYQSSKRAMTPSYGGTASGKTPGYNNSTPGYGARTPGHAARSAKTPGY